MVRAMDLSGRKAAKDAGISGCQRQEPFYVNEHRPAIERSPVQLQSFATAPHQAYLSMIDSITFATSSHLSVAISSIW